MTSERTISTAHGQSWALSRKFPYREVSAEESKDH